MTFTIIKNEDKSIHMKYEIDVLDWNELIDMKILDKYFW